MRRACAKLTVQAPPLDFAPGSLLVARALLHLSRAPFWNIPTPSCESVDMDEMETNSEKRSSEPVEEQTEPFDLSTDRTASLNTAQDSDTKDVAGANSTAGSHKPEVGKGRCVSSDSKSVEDMVPGGSYGGPALELRRAADDTGVTGTPEIPARLQESRSHQCPDCGKRFSSKHLARHLRTHTGEKPHLCGECGKRFGDSYSLVVHRRTHTGERPYQCHLCSKTFSDGSSMRKHKRAHFERPHQCSECRRRYADLPSLWKHQLVHSAAAESKAIAALSIKVPSFRFHGNTPAEVLSN